MSEQWLSIVEYTRLYNVSDMTVRRRIKSGKLDAVLKDQKYYIRVPIAQQQQPSRRESAPQPTPAHQPMRHEVEVVKGHPHAQRTYHQAPVYAEPAPQPQPAPRAHAYPQTYVPEPAMPSAPDYSEAIEQGLIPSSLKRPLAGYETALVDTRALLAFCEATMRKVQDAERRQTEKFKAKLEAVEATLEAKDQEIKALKQQLEDLQLLVKIMEKKR